MTDAVVETDLPLANKRTGKVRDVYDMTLPDGGDGVLIVATDRVSVFDVVLANGIPDKGKLLTRLSTFWFGFFDGKFDHHLVSTNVDDVPGLTAGQKSQLDGRIMICRRNKVIPIECIVRGYLTGSGYKDYVATGSLCGIALPAGLTNSEQLPQTIFTPSTKPEEGHDENISFETGCDLVGKALMTQVRDISLEIYDTGRAHAADCGIIIADTKFEFGLQQGSTSPVLIDEVLTPDSSRFWPAEEYEAGREQNSFDKQYVRNYTETLVAAGDWDKEYPGPALPAEVIDNTLRRYDEAIRRLGA